MKLFPFAVLLMTLACRAQDYPLGPDSNVQPGVPKGTVKKFVLAPGKYYPGVPHNYQVYVPAQYDAAKPTAMMIHMDGGGAAGNGQRVPIVLDNLIAKKDIPVMIGIFVDPGMLPVADKEAQNRFERVFEYDSLSDRFASFLVDELIPEVAKTYNLSKNPDDRGLAGVSTGAVGAFMAAWNRPDQFHRVMSFIGTFVAMKGADALPALIRRTEPKPLRIYLQAGKNDHVIPGQPYGTFYAGSWPINNQAMLEAMQFAGYDAKLVLGDEGHNMKQGASIMPEAYRWLWRDYGTPIKQGVPEKMGDKGWDPRGKVYSTVTAGKTWEAVATVPQAIQGVAADKDGNIYYCADKIYGPKGALAGTEGCGPLKAGPDGRIYAVQNRAGSANRVVAFAPGGGDAKVLAENANALDLTVTSKGAVYFTTATAVMRVEPGGRLTTAYAGGELARPQGLALSGDEAMLAVTDAVGRLSWSFQIAADGTLVNGEPFFRLEMPETGWMSGVTAAAQDSTGQVYFATPVGIQGAEANGRVAMILNPPVTPGRVSAFAFAGGYLYAAEGQKLYRRPALVQGVGAWSVVKLPKPPL